MQNSQIKNRASKGTILKTKSWESMHSGFNALKFTVQLLEGQPNAKHQKLTLSIEIVWESEQLIYHKQFKTSDLPSQAITIFSDVETLYDYIEQFSNDSSRIKFNPEQNTFTIINIVVMKNKELKQEIVLFLDRETYVIEKEELENMQIEDKSFLNQSQISSISSKHLLQESKVMIESLIKDKNSQLESKITILSDHLNNFINQIKILRNQNKLFSSALNSCNMTVAKLQKQTTYLNDKVIQLQRQKANLADIKQPQTQIPSTQLHQNVQQLKKQLSDSKWNIDQLQHSIVNIRQTHIQIQKFKQKFEQQAKTQQKSDHVLPLVNQMRKQIIVLNNKVFQMKENTSRLGTKMFFSVDVKTNKYIDNFRIIENIVEKISGDQQRHQLLGSQSFSLSEIKTKSYFEIKIISTTNSQVVVGIVGQNRRGERFSYDKKECVCYDGQGFIFEQGHKVRMPFQLHNGQTIKVVLDPFQALVHWFVGYTEVGSTFIPESMRKMRILPYFQLYYIGDKIAING